MVNRVMGSDREVIDILEVENTCGVLDMGI